MTIDTSKIREAVPGGVLELCQRLRDAGHRAWVVGGCVRDELLAEMRAAGPNAHTLRNDWDIATDARPRQVQKIFDRVIPTGIKHGTVTVLVGDDAFEVTTLRGEAGYTDARRPDTVYFVDDIVADLSRRDFTINAIAYDPLEDRLHDPFGGIDDLKRGVLRAVGKPAERFAEDGLRVLRAARFSATLEVEIDDDTARAIEPSLGSYAKVSPERIREEWVKAMKARRPSRAFQVMHQHGMLAITAPDLLALSQVQHPSGPTAWEYTLACVDACPAQTTLRMAALLHDVARPGAPGDDPAAQAELASAKAEALLAMLRLSNAEREHIVALVRHHAIGYQPSWSDSDVRRWLVRVGPGLLPDLFVLANALTQADPGDSGPVLEGLHELEARARRSLDEGAALSTRDLCVTGHDLMRELDRQPGPWLGDVLRALLDEVIDDPKKNEPAWLLARARELL